MYDELVERLNKYSAEHEHHGGIAAEAADAIEELQAAEKKYLANISALEAENQHLKRERDWIPVTERLPEDLTRVIVFCEDGVWYGLCEHLIADDEEVVEWHDFLHYPITPTHWMPLPQPPKEGT